MSEPSLQPIAKTAWSMPQELGITKGRKPQEHEGLSGVVIITDDFGGSGFGYIRFKEDTVTRLARKMPKGVGPAHPAYIHVVRGIDYWYVYCQYLESQEGVLLWRQNECPEWAA